MQKVEPIKILTIDEVPYAVDGLSEQVQALVAMFNDWSLDEAHQRNKLAKTQAAKQELSRQIIGAVRVEIDAKAAAEEVAKAEAVVPPLEEAVVTEDGPAEVPVANDEAEGDA